jgi:pyruvate/2-oxoglutarate dehydrogenase complex dihydrolipoamide acyltransferase (E2) component
MRVRFMLAAALITTSTFTLAGTGIASASTASGSFAGCPTLSEGHSSGDCVIRLQNDLDVVNSGYHLQSDGIFGRDTRIAVIDFQGRNHLGADGIVGSATADELTRQSQAQGSVPTPAPSATSANEPAAPQPHMLLPEKAREIALGLIDATGDLGVQCGLGKIGDKIRAGSVPADAVKASLALSDAKSACSGVKNMAEAVGVITALAAFDQPVYVTETQSAKNKWWGLGFVKTCTVDVQAGASERLSHHFKASFTCH